MKRFLCSTLLFALFAFAFSACNDDDSSSTSEALIGKWEHYKQGLVISGQEMTEDYEHTPGCTKDYSEFQDNNIMQSHSYENDNCQEFVDIYTWNREGNTLTIQYPGENAEIFEIREITATQLKLHSQDEGLTYVSILRRIN